MSADAGFGATELCVASDFLTKLFQKGTTSRAEGKEDIMPRGYLKRKSNTVGRKRSRGGNSHQAMFSRTPRWVQNERQRTESNVKKNRDNYIREHFSAVEIDRGDYMQENFPTKYDEFGFHDELPISSLQGEESHPTKSQNTGEADEALDSFDVDTGLVDFGSFPINVDAPEQPLGEYSLRGGSNVISSDGSFSLCEQSCVGTSTSGSFFFVDNGSQSVVSDSVSTLWEFVDNAISQADGGSVGPLGSGVKMNQSNVASELKQNSIAPLGSTVKATESDVESVVSELPDPFAQCAICLEDKKSTQRFMNRCNHPRACKDCLRTHYLKHQVQDISNFPLKCFWPGCNGGVRDVQIRRLVQSQREMSHYYAQASRARTMRREQQNLEREVTRIAALQNKLIQNFKVLQQCSACPETQPVYPSKQDGFTCRQCGTDSAIDIMPKEEIHELVHALGDHLVNCPACEVLIVKDGGCDHMTCVCGHEFNFSEAVERLVGKWAAVGSSPRRNEAEENPLDIMQRNEDEEGNPLEDEEGNPFFILRRTYYGEHIYYWR